MVLSTTYTKTETDFLIQQLEEKTSNKYNDESNSIANDIIKRVDKNTGENVNYRETTTWHDGTTMDDSKVDGDIFVKRGSKYYVLSEFINQKIINIKKIGAVGDGIADDTNAILKAINFVRNFNGKKITIFIPNGIYRHSNLGAIAIKNLTIKGESPRGVILKAIHSGIALNMDAFEGATDNTPFVQNCNLVNLLVEGNENTTVGIFAQGLARCNWSEITFRNGSTSCIGFKFKGVQLSNFRHLQCSTDIDNMVSVPEIGIQLDYGHRNLTGIGNSSNNSFYDIQMEGLPIGIHLKAADQQVFYTGTSESCLNYGLLIGTNSRYNTFIGTGFENKDATADISDSGIHNSFIGCYASKGTLIDGVGCNIKGGYYDNVNISSTARCVSIENITTKYFNPDSFGIVDNASDSIIQHIRVYNKATTSYDFPPSKYNTKGWYSHSLVGKLISENGLVSVTDENSITPFRNSEHVSFNNKSGVGIAVERLGNDESSSNVGSFKIWSPVLETNMHLYHLKMVSTNNWTKPVALQNISAGITSDRPVGELVGETYFDTTLNKPIWFNGTNWVDVNGTTV